MKPCAPSAVATRPCARLSGLCGLAALVAGLVAISFLATHASAADDLCANEDCGEGTCAVDVDNDIPLCVCKDGLVFDDDHKTCVVAPLVRTTVALQQGGSRSIVPASFLAPLPAEQASGSSACGNLYVTIEGSAKITVVWNASNPAPPVDEAPSNAMCKSLSLYAESGCTKKLRFTIARPAKKGSSYPVTIKTVKGIRSLLSVGCEISKRANRSASAPRALVFNAAKKLCLDPSRAPRRRP
ncbi:unnamed protein product [Closterium sp. NIES-65]|nr:unnamed protein product [Closterium sp. NIES-65]